MLTRGLEWDLVTSKSESNVATVFDVIEVPLSAWTTSGMPWMPKISFIISTARIADSVACTCAPTMNLEWISIMR